MKRMMMIEGMSCEHCVRALTEELQAIGVDGVQVDLPTGTTYIDYEQDITDDALREAVHASGYTLVSLD